MSSDEPQQDDVKRRKRRKRVSAQVENEAAPAENEREAAPAEPNAEPDEGLPAFARAFPRDDQGLAALLASFEAGDYARVRREAPKLARETDRDDVRRAARELSRRLDPDPMAVYMLMAAAALLVFLAGWYWLHPHVP